MPEKLKHKLRAVFDKARPISQPDRGPSEDRYVPRSLDGGAGWRIYDKTERRFLTNKELRSLTVAELVHAKVYDA